MKFPFRYLAFSLVLFSTTFCSKDNQTPSSKAGEDTVRSSDALLSQGGYNYGYPLGFNPQLCNADTAGMGAVLFPEAKANIYNWTGHSISDADFAATKAAITSSPYFTFDANGHVFSNVPYANRLNGFTDGVKQQLQEYDYYVYYASLQGVDVQDPEDVKAIIREQFDANIPFRNEEYNTVGEYDRDQLELITSSARPQMERGLALFDALYRCEGSGGGAAGTNPEAQLNTKGLSAMGTGKGMITFKQFVQLRKTGQIQDPSRDVKYKAQSRSFFKKLKVAVRKVFTIVAFTALGVGLGVSGGPAGAIIGGALGISLGVGLVRDNRCLFVGGELFGPCQ